MLENVISTIICSQFEKEFGRTRERLSDPDNAMSIRFNLATDYEKEDGYRSLAILLFGFGTNYIGVFAQLQWNVWRGENEPVRGGTPWVLISCHDSCWREGVSRLIWEYRERILTIDSVFQTNRWYSTVLLSNQEKKDFRNVIRETPGYGDNHGPRVKLKDLEFFFNSHTAV